MSVAGKKRDEWVAVTLTDFATPGRREELRHHYSLEAAFRAWEGILKIYDKTWNSGTQVQARVWQETKEGELINENGPQGVLP